MIIEHENKRYETVYFPFFRIKQEDDFSIFGMRLPSGRIDEVMIFEDDVGYMDQLKAHTAYLLKEYALEEDIMLTQRALELKYDIRDLFGI